MWGVVFPSRLHKIHGSGLGWEQLTIHGLKFNSRLRAPAWILFINYSQSYIAMLHASRGSTWYKPWINTASTVPPKAIQSTVPELRTLPVLEKPPLGGVWLYDSASQYPSNWRDVPFEDTCFEDCRLFEKDHKPLTSVTWRSLVVWQCVAIPLQLTRCSIWRHLLRGLSTVWDRS
jgi:hypothetical protein